MLQAAKNDNLLHLDNLPVRKAQKFGSPPGAFAAISQREGEAPAAEARSSWVVHPHRNKPLQIRP
ncbi:hypothetical protein [Cupriavidus nantongensis]|uniref:hypothetical protein n=1 Tax=Cupriavidus nantongensis TaxID=1796606 RepID=UPI00358E03D1